MDTKTPVAANNSQTLAKPKAVTEAYTFSKDGWPRIRKAAITFTIALLISIALVTACRLVLLRAQPVALEAQGKESAARDKYNQAESERIEIRDFLPKFEQLRARGFFGEEQRLNMLEAIKRIQEARHLLPINYEFAPQQIVTVDPSLLAAPLELRATKVTLHMGLLHELDLFNFLQDLKTMGFYTVKECLLTPIETRTDAPLAPNLNAECSLYWLTIGQTAAPAVEATPTQ
ncbi:MAG: hypothetical protein V4805_12300 [Pseudomonadota bacterium]